MAMRGNAEAQITSLVRTSISTILSKPIILYPLCITAFIQLLVLEILYFAPRYPLAFFFNAPISRLWGEAYLHYPANFILLPKLFYYCQLTILLFVSGFLGAATISIIAAINHDEKKIMFRSILKENMARYIHIFMVIVISLSSFSLLSVLAKKLAGLATVMKAQAGSLAFIDKFFHMGEPYFNLLLGVFTTVIFIFVIPIIVLEKKKLSSAFILNFQYLKGCFWLMFTAVLLPTLFYVPILFLRNNISIASHYAVPEIQVVLIVVGIVMTLFIDAIVYTATTTYYLFIKETQ